MQIYSSNILLYKNHSDQNLIYFVDISQMREGGYTKNDTANNMIYYFFIFKVSRMNVTSNKVIKDNEWKAIKLKSNITPLSLVITLSHFRMIDFFAVSIFFSLSFSSLSLFFFFFFFNNLFFSWCNLLAL